MTPSTENLNDGQTIMLEDRQPNHNVKSLPSTLINIIEIRNHSNSLEQLVLTY